MACDKSGISYEVIIGAAFCSGACGTKRLMWQTTKHVYTNGSDCTDDVYKGCC
ncbi:hypothetical protein ACQKII_06595 [Lysinibacillus sp. NPDC048646]|uniref:hypothetical protein n=1 Tax=Lysinibacillus sp. NPDC048646 TaxID=3390574 RepID=UPI003CFD5CA1